MTLEGSGLENVGGSDVGTAVGGGASQSARRGDA